MFIVKEYANIDLFPLQDGSHSRTSHIVAKNINTRSHQMASM